jgi:S-adenosylmethionine synthetase
LAAQANVIDTNITGLVALTRAVLPKLIERRGAVINLSSVAATYPYEKTAAYGHFGRKPDGDLFTWEKTDLVDQLKAAL